MGIDGCYERAKSKHFDTFAVQSGGQCYTSPTASDTYRIYGPSKGCSSDGTGGTWSQEVYKIGMIIIVWSISVFTNISFQQNIIQSVIYEATTIPCR